MFFFVPETFWDRTPRPHAKSRMSTFKSISGFFHQNQHERKSATSFGADGTFDQVKLNAANSTSGAEAANTTIAERRQHKNSHHVGFVDNIPAKREEEANVALSEAKSGSKLSPPRLEVPTNSLEGAADEERKPTPYPSISLEQTKQDLEAASKLQNEEPPSALHQPDSAMTVPVTAGLSEKSSLPRAQAYTTYLQSQPAKTFAQTLRPWNGRLRQDNWLKVAARPFILYAYPSILWSALVYSLSIGWLIVLSESVSEIYRGEDYHFTALQVGLVYISPFIGGVLGTAVAGKVSDIVVRIMSRRNGGVYEPEFRLVMAIPVAIATCIGLMGFGWSAEEKDSWIVPTVFFGVISFGSSLGSTTSITFAVVSAFFGDVHGTRELIDMLGLLSAICW